MPTCRHPESSVFRCSNITRDDAHRFHSRFYESADKQLQDALIVKCYGTSGKRLAYDTSVVKTPNAQMFVPTSGRPVRVCLHAFCGILRIGLKRVRNLTTFFQRNGRLRGERRGGIRENAQYTEKTESVCRLIQNLKASSRITPAYTRKECINRLVFSWQSCTVYTTSKLQRNYARSELSSEAFSKRDSTSASGHRRPTSVAIAFPNGKKSSECKMSEHLFA